MIGLKEPELCGNQGRTWSEAIADSLLDLLDIPCDGGELICFVAIIVIVVLVAGIGAAIES